MKCPCPRNISAVVGGTSFSLSVLVGLVFLFYVLTIVKMKAGS